MNSDIKNSKGFTLVELLIVIIILAIIAIFAIPKYADLKNDAELASARGVFAAAQGASAINFATMIVSPNQAPAGSGVRIETGQNLLDAMRYTPDEWVISFPLSLQKLANGRLYSITIGSVETDQNKAALLFSCNDMNNGAASCFP